MYYLKCNNCGHFNESKTEFLIFCSECGKKLDNNYSEWKRKNPGRTYDEFRSLVCTTTKEEASQRKSNLKSGDNVRLKKYLAGFIIGFIILFTLTLILAKPIINSFRKIADGQVLIKKVNNKNIINSNIKDRINEINKLTPIALNNDISLIKIEILQDNIIQMDYKLSNIEAGSLDTEAFKNIMIATVKTDPNMKSIKDAGFTLNMHFIDMNDESWFEFLVDNEDY